MGEEEKNEAQILFPEIEAGGFKVRPWSLKQFFTLMPTFVKIAEALNARGVTWGAFEDMAKGTGERAKLWEILADLEPFLPGIIGVTVGCSAKEAEEMEFDRALSISLVILIQNVERVKNFSGLAKVATESLLTSPS